MNEGLKKFRKIISYPLAPKVAFFFSRDKFRGHSLTQILKKCFFFPKNWKKKNKRFLFFPRNSLWATHSKIFETLYFYIGKSCLACFFFPAIFGMIFVFFFSSEKFTFTHSLGWKTCFFFSRCRKKKKTGFSHTHPIFAEKSKKTNYSREKKTLPLTKAIA